MTQNINFPIVLRVIGWLLLIEGAYMLLPLLVSLWFHEYDTVTVFALSIAITLLAGVLMTFGLRPADNSMRKREGIILTAVIWVFFSAFGMLPYLFSGTLSNVTDAFFETMSGFTTTGSTLITDVESLPHGIIFWRSSTQWLGGMGIILFTLAVLPMLNYKGGIALFNAEVTGITHERIRPRVSQTAKDLWIIYITLSAIMAALLWQPMGWFDAVCHTMATVSTGGYSSRNMGLQFWNSYYVYGVVMVFMFLGGMNFTLLYALTRGRLSLIRRNDTFKFYVTIIVLVSVIILFRMWDFNYFDNWTDRVTLAFFDTIAAATSTGFTSVRYETQGEFIAFIIMVLMVFGGMAGSTSGGAKIDRFLVMVKNSRNEFYRVLHSNAVTAVRIDGKAIPHQIVSKVIAFISIYLLVMVAVALILAFLGLPMFDSLFTSVSVLSNFGFGYGVTAEPGSFIYLPTVAKWLLALEMLVGRLELFTVLILFTRRFWLKD